MSSAKSDKKYVQGRKKPASGWNHMVDLSSRERQKSRLNIFSEFLCLSSAGALELEEAVHPGQLGAAPCGVAGEGRVIPDAKFGKGCY